MLLFLIIGLYKFILRQTLKLIVIIFKYNLSFSFFIIKIKKLAQRLFIFNLEKFRPIYAYYVATFITIIYYDFKLNLYIYILRIKAI